MEAATTTATDSVTFVIPTEFAALADVASQEETRYSINGIALMDSAGRGASAQATDGRICARVPLSVEYNESMEPLGLGVPAIVPLHAWRHAFAKLGRGKRRPESVRLQLVRRGATFPWTWIVRDGLGSVLSGSCIEGRWPDVDAILAVKERGPARCVSLDCGHLSRLVSGLGLDSGERAPALVFTEAGPKGWGPVLVAHEGDGEAIARGGTVPILAGAIMPRTAT